MNTKMPTVGHMERRNGEMTELQFERVLLGRDIALKVQNGVATKCDRHGIFYNPKEASQCPLCGPKPIVKMASEVRNGSRKWEGLCKHCRAKTIYPDGICSQYECLRKEGLDATRHPRVVFFQCRFCRGKTKEGDRICTRYQCRKKGGKIYIYQQK